MPIESVTSYNQPFYRMNNFQNGNNKIAYGHMNMPQKNPESTVTKKDKFCAMFGAVAGVSIPVAYLMKKQNTKNLFKLKYGVKEMLLMAASGNIGGILMSSIGESKQDKLKKWKEGAFQMSLTATPMLLVDGIIKLCEKSKNPKINNNFTKILASIGGVAVGSNAAITLFNHLRSGKEAKKPKRELKLVDMVANLDDAVAVCVLAKIPFADKIHIERALPFIYSFCGYRSGTGENRY